MTKFIITLAVAAAAAGGYLYWSSSDDRGSVGDPVLSLTPAVSTTAATGPIRFTDGTYELVAASSSMQWTGTKTLIKDYVDHGTVNLSAGVATVVDGKVASGSVTVDMKTIKTLSTGKGSGESMQEKHIKGPDFFDVEKYPTAQFVLTDIAARSDGTWQVNGTLTIRTITKPVSFSAAIIQDGDTLTMRTGEVPLDRTEWDIRYASGKFFKNLGDSIIGDIFTVSFTAVGRIAR